MTKFISKSNNLHIILRPGLQASPLTGTQAKPAISVRFQDGMANVADEELVQMMLNHPGFDSDFISAEDKQADPYAYLRQESEPAHIITDIKFGTPQKSTGTKVKPQMPPEVLKLIQEQAAAIARQMLPSMVTEALKTIVEAQETTKASKSSGSVDVPEALKMATEEGVGAEDVYNQDGELIENNDSVNIPEVKKSGRPAAPKK